MSSTEEVKEKNIVIRPDPRLGQPGPLAHKVFVALIKKHSDYGRPVQKEISFTKREIMRLVGRKAWGGQRQRRTFARPARNSLRVRQNTFQRWGCSLHRALLQHLFGDFDRTPGICQRSDRGMHHHARRPIIASLQDEHFTCLNHALMMQLGTIGQALYMRLFFHLANLYDGANSPAPRFPEAL